VKERLGFKVDEDNVDAKREADTLGVVEESYGALEILTRRSSGYVS